MWWPFSLLRRRRAERERIADRLRDQAQAVSRQSARRVAFAPARPRPVVEERRRDDGYGLAAALDILAATEPTPDPAPCADASPASSPFESAPSCDAGSSDYGGFDGGSSGGGGGGSEW